MELIATVFSVLFIGLILATALTFSVALLIWFIGIAVLITVVVLLRDVFRRWRFIHNASRPDKPPRIIEGDYKDISEK